MSLPWREENDTYVITAYFKDPSLICSKKHSHARYIGDRLLIQNTSKSAGLVQIPLLEEGLLKTVWTEGECFWSMGKLLRCLVLRSQFTALIYRQHSLVWLLQICTSGLSLTAVYDHDPTGHCGRQFYVYDFIIAWFLFSIPSFVRNKKKYHFLQQILIQSLEKRENKRQMYSTFEFHQTIFFVLACGNASLIKNDSAKSYST